MFRKKTMQKQALIIGLGQFGMSLARALAQRGMEVLAVDRRAELVRTAASIVTEAVCFDAMDEQALGRAAPERRDVCVVGIGDEAREASIICTALLRQLGARRIIARAANPLHSRILQLVGAHEVVNPEVAFAEGFANRLVYETVMAELSLGEDLVVTELEVPTAFVGRSLADLAMPRRFGVTVVAIRRPEKPVQVLPGPKELLAPHDIVVVVSRAGAVVRMLERSQ
jgi:trk system potassium uptake protein TrkA